MANGLSNYHLIKMKYKWKYYKLYEKFNQSKSSLYLYLNIVLCVYIYLISLSDLPLNKITIIKYTQDFSFFVDYNLVMKFITS